MAAPEVRLDAELLRALPGLARIAASSAWRLTEWSVQTTVRTAGEVLASLAAGQVPSQVVQERVGELRAVARQALGLPQLETAAERRNGQVASSGSTVAALRERGAQLLRDSADVWLDVDTHPAYERILDELAPDEARILRFLAVEGPQPSIDVRTSRPLGIGSELVEAGLSMIGVQSGVRNTDRTRAYLNNLYRLGLIWFSREQVDDPSRYQVVEVQPDVVEALKGAGRMPKTVHRSIHLTPFGHDFVDTCLPLPPAGATPSRNGQVG